MTLIRFNIVLTLSILFCSLDKTVGQDIHFSQYKSSLVIINPANAGVMNGDYRFNLNYKSQWNSIGSPYTTAYAAYDMNMLKYRSKSGFMGMAVSFLKDKTGQVDFGLSQFNMALSYHIKVSSNDYFGAGIKAGLSQRSINVSKFKWGNQFNGDNYDPNIDSGELLTSTQNNYIDFSAGLSWNHTSDRESRFNVGVSMDHVNKPSVTFYGNSTSVYTNRISSHGGVNIPIVSDEIYINPSFFYSRQGPLNEFIIGFDVSKKFGMNSLYTGTNISSVASLGLYYRNKDALIFLTNFNLKESLSIGFSYDINTSQLKVASRSRGGVEIYISYKGIFSGENKKSNNKILFYQ